MILLIDNYDSFVFNLARYVGELGHQRVVVRNDKITISEIDQLRPSHIIISPGPCTPNEAGVSLDTISNLGPRIPILGICLGHQAIGQVYGGIVCEAKNPMHGKFSYIEHNSQEIFKNLPNPLKVARYHSLAVKETDLLTKQAIITARSDDGEIMAIQHLKFPVYGVQFHPESVLTPMGKHLIYNFLNMYGDGSKNIPPEMWHNEILE